MKKQLLSAALTATLGFAVMPFAAHAANTITIVGKVTSQSCSVSVNGASGNLTVTLPTVTASQFTAIGATAGWTPLAITVTGCASGSTGVTTVAPFFENGAQVNIDPNTGYLQNIGTSTGLEIALSKNGTVAAGSALTLQNPGTIVSGVTGQGVTAQTIPSSTSGTLTFNLYAGYVSTAATVTAGSAGSFVNYDLAYN